MNLEAVAQIFNLPFRRFEIGQASARSCAPELADDPQNAILRYGRLKICATSIAGRLTETTRTGELKVSDGAKHAPVGLGMP